MAYLFTFVSHLMRLEIPTALETRRVRSDLIETFKIINCKYNINSELFSNRDRVIDKWNSLTDTLCKL